MSLKANDRLFDSMSALSKQHAENSGSYTFIVSDYKRKTEAEIRAEVKKEMEEEPAPTVSLYNLLDHSEEQLDYLLTAIESQAIKVEGFKRMNPIYTDMHKSLLSWVALVRSVKRERISKDTKAWAEKTAKEIKETDNQFQAQQDSGGTL